MNGFGYKITQKKAKLCIPQLFFAFLMAIGNKKIRKR